jgi:hypothetical protein
MNILYFNLVILALFIAATIVMVNANTIEREYYATKTQVAQRFATFIEKLGTKAWHFLECLGWDAAIDCAEPIIGTLLVHDIPDAIELIVCEAPKMKRCAPTLR